MTLRATAALWIAAAIACSVAAGETFQVPPINGHVVDTSGKLDAADVRELDSKLAAFRTRTGFAVAVFVPGSLAGMPIEDVAYQTFNRWKIGEAGKDNGVLVVIAPVERQVRIETGKGVGGALTDLQANDIIRTKMNPLLAKGQLRPAIEAGCTAIEAALERDVPAVRPLHGKPSRSGSGSGWVVYVVVGVLVLLLVLAIISPTARAMMGPLWQLVSALLQLLSLFSGGGGGGKKDGGGGSYKGGGGRSGGGGSSDRF